MDATELWRKLKTAVVWYDYTADDVRQLLDQKADPNHSPGSWHNEPILHAAVKSKYDCSQKIQVLINEGHCNVNTRDYAGNTALSYACMSTCKRKTHEVSILLEAQADPNIEGCTTPLRVAARDSSIEVVQMLLDHNATVNPSVPKSVVLSWKEPPLFFAARRKGDDASVAQLLLDHGANLNILNYEGETPLCAATRHKNIKVMTLLLDRGAELNYLQVIKSPPLQQPNNYHSQLIVRDLMEKQRTPLSYCYDNFSINAARLLLSRGANPNIVSPGDPDLRPRERPTVPLARAVDWGSIELILLLIEYKADIRYSDPSDHSLIARAAGRISSPSEMPLLNLLLEAGALPNAPSSHSPLSLCKSPEVAEQLLNHGADPNMRSSISGETPLYAATGRKNVPIMRLLLERKADPDATVGRSTALLNAIGHGDVEIVRVLLDHGASPNTPPENPPLFSAVKYASSRCCCTTSIIELLLDHHADILAVYDVCIDQCMTQMRLHRHFSNDVDNSELMKLLRERFTEAQAQRNLALAMGAHIRLGRNSLLSSLDPHLLSKIAQ